MFVVLNGEIMDSKKAMISPFDSGFLYGDGVYDTLRTYDGKLWQAQKHLARLEKSAKRLQLKLPFSKVKIVEMIEKLIKKNRYKEARIRVTITRGINKGFSGCEKPTLFIHAVPLVSDPQNVYEKGVSAITVHYERMAPEAKTTSLLPMVLAHQEIDKRKVFEAIYVDCLGYVREGTITNVAIIKDGILFTPKTKILEGTTRSLVIKLAEKIGLKTKIEDFKVDKLYNADEVFLSNAPRKIIPVRKIDETVIGKGKPGIYTKQLMDVFDEYVRKNKLR